MTTRVDALTAEQTARLPEWRDRWIRIGLSTEPADRPAAERALVACHGYAGLEAPPIMWVQSPEEMAEAIGTRVRASVWASVWASVRASVEASVRASVEASVGASVWASVWASVGASVWASVWASVGASVRASVEASVGASVWASYAGGQWWVHWSAMESYYREVCGLVRPGDLSDRGRAYADLCASAGAMLLYRDVAIVMDRPAVIRLAEGRLHGGADHYAIEWRDGTGIAAWRGTVIPSDWIRPGLLTPAVALAERNPEARRAGCEILGWDRIIQDLDARVIDADPDPTIGTLLRVNLPDAPRTQFLRVRCGTGRTFVLCVPPHVQTAAAAQRWMLGLPSLSTIPLPTQRS